MNSVSFRDRDLNAVEIGWPFGPSGLHCRSKSAHRLAADLRSHSHYSRFSSGWNDPGLLGSWYSTPGGVRSSSLTTVLLVPLSVTMSGRPSPLMSATASAFAPRAARYV